MGSRRHAIPGGCARGGVARGLLLTWLMRTSSWPLLVLVVSFPVLANQLGAVGYSGKTSETCNMCHSGGGTPTVSITGPGTLQAGQSGNYTLTVSGGAGSRAGMNVSVDVADARLEGVAGDTAAFSNEVHQVSPKAFSGGRATFSFKLVAPPYSGTVRLFGSGNSCNGNGGTSGDRAGLTTLSVTVTGGTTAPRVANAPAASPETVTGKTTQLSVLGADDQPEAALTYTWTVASGPGAVTFAPNGTNAAKQATATFQRAGSYVLQVQVKDAQGQGAASTVSVTVQPTLAGVAVTPASGQVLPRGTKQFAARAVDQFGGTLASPADFTWMATSGGAISPTGLFTAGSSLGGPHIIQALGGGKAGSATVTVVSEITEEDTAAPTVALASHRAGATLTGVVTLQAKADDDVGVARVEYLLDGVAVGDATQAPWSVALNSAAYPSGPATLTLVAYDAAGNAGASAGVAVVLDNPLTPGAGGCSAVGGGPLAALALGLLLARRRR